MSELLPPRRAQPCGIGPVVPSPRLLYCALNPAGGLADYAHEQANALVRAGVDVTLLSTPSFFARPRALYRADPRLEDPSSSDSRSRTAVGRLRRSLRLLANIRRLGARIKEQRYEYVLMASYVEYLAPLWARTLRRLAARGVVFGSVIHDPVRDFVVGPLWWHRKSVAAGYSFLREAFVHESIDLETVRMMPQLRTTVIPIGVFRFPPPAESRAVTRARLGIPEEVFTLLAFGHVRDNKNLDLVIRAVADIPQVRLIIAGTVNSARQKPIEFYKSLAQKLKVADRCHWVNQFIPESNIGNYFNAADVVVLTYSRTFRSASGVLNTAVQYRRQCLASAGESALQTAVEKYGLGIWVPPDDATAIRDALSNWSDRRPAPQWDRYESENGWERNAVVVWERMRTSLSREAR